MIIECEEVSGMGLRMIIVRRNRIHILKKSSPVHFVHHKSHVTGPEIDPW
jgi:hypothetical protein